MKEYIHTPGPWRLKMDPRDDEYDTPYMRLEAGDKNSPDSFSIHGFIEEADARLMWKAPDLLAMIKAASEKIETLKNTMNMEYPCRGSMDRLVNEMKTLIVDVEGDPLSRNEFFGECDCCAKQNARLSKTVASGIDTAACPRCRGEEG